MQNVLRRWLVFLRSSLFPSFVPYLLSVLSVSCLAQDGFNDALEDARVKWIQYVMSVDESSGTRHKAPFYVIVARAMAELMGSVSPSDYEEPHMRDMIKTGVVVGATPFDKEGETRDWRTVKLQPVHVAVALRVAGKALDDKARATAAQAAAPQTGLTNVMSEYIKAQQAVLEKDKKKGTLSFNLADRIKEVGLADFTTEALPSEDALIRLEAAGKPACDQGRMYVGAVDGEDLQANFRPRWSRTPKLDVGRRYSGGEDACRPRGTKGESHPGLGGCKACCCLLCFLLSESARVPLAVASLSAPCGRLCLPVLSWCVVCRRDLSRSVWISQDTRTFRAMCLIGASRWC